MTFFRTDINSPFLFRGGEIKKIISNSHDLDELKGSIIKLYIPYKKNGERRAAFIKLPLPFLKDQ
ncbi:MAG: hypothetical protein JXR86_04285 [Spirochaetales bacterium]|nr:hypothetical protein [Spirochaetales bacterium]